MYVSPNNFAKHLKLTQYSISTVSTHKGTTQSKSIRTNLVSDLSFAAVVLGLLRIEGVPGKYHAIQ